MYRNTCVMYRKTCVMYRNTCVMYRNSFQMCYFIFTQFISILLIFQFIYYLPLCFILLLTFNIFFIFSCLCFHYYVSIYHSVNFSILNVFLAGPFFLLCLYNNWNLFTYVFSSFIDLIFPDSLRYIVLAANVVS